MVTGGGQWVYSDQDTALYTPRTVDKSVTHILFCVRCSQIYEMLNQKGNLKRLGIKVPWFMWPLV